MEPITILFNTSLATGVFPEVLKEGYIVPIHKGESKENAKNYRPITIQPAIAKLFEKLVLLKIGPFFNSIITTSQH